ncbi:MAG: alpha/beta hydrolase [Clostridia bacterium]|nr:alpha/beta hydrolase [Clostridia bacterium]
MWWEILLIALGSCLLALLIFASVQSLRYRRSLASSLVEIYLRLTTVRFSYTHILARLTEKRSRPEKRVRLKPASRGITTEEYDFSGCQVFVLTPREAPAGRAILYLYGGGYVRLPRRSHLRYVKRLARKSGVRIVFPIYPRAPYHNAKETREFAASLYGAMAQRLTAILLMGDSSGGGLALLLANELYRQSACPLPRALILFSPFIDVSLECVDYRAYERRDPLIYMANTLAGAVLWADGNDMTSPEVSPYYADAPRQENFYIYTGDRELLYPAIVAYSERLTAEGVEHTLKVGRGMNHVYQIYPIPEARRELKEVGKIIKSVL